MTQLIQQHEFLKQTSQKILKELTDCDNLTKDILQNVVLDTIKRYQQKIDVGIQDSVSDLLLDFKAKILNTVLTNIQGWRLTKRECFLFPKNCRFCFNYGSKTIIVIEQEPQVKSLLFDKNMLDSITNEKCGQSERISLSMPYVIFVGEFKQNKLSSLFCSWRASPLKSMSDYLGQSVLPNIHSNLSVCLGNPPEVSVERMDEIVSYFWNSQFNQDLMSHWATKHLLHKNLANARIWAQASIDDPLFILNVKFPHPPERTLGHFIDRLIQYEHDGDQEFITRKVSELVDYCVNGLFHKIMNFLKKTKFEIYYPKNVSNELEKTLHRASQELSNLVLAMQVELDSLKVGLGKLNPIVAQGGSFWN